MIRFGSEGRRDVPEEAVAADLAAGRMVLCIDPRGTGETRAEGQSDWQMYLSSVTLGRHYAAMRAWDVRRAVDCLLARGDVATVALGVSGGPLAGLTGLLAAACDPRLARVEVEQLLHSYRGQPDFGELNQAGQLGIVPNLLPVADVEDLLALAAPREVTVRQFVNSLGEPVPVAAAGLRCTAVYALLEAASALRLPS
ncbi:MAG: hypothetical protein HYU66_27900 [Armatimonadetes bacterium]|nr:hypothetical protein [Armatimonadota bacterium]